MRSSLYTVIDAHKGERFTNNGGAQTGCFLVFIPILA